VKDEMLKNDCVERFYEFICQYCEIDDITPDNIEYVRKKMKERALSSSYKEIANKLRIHEVYLRRLLNQLKKYPQRTQRTIIKAMYVLSENNNRKLTMQEIAEYMHMKRISSYIVLPLLKKLGIIEYENGSSRPLRFSVNRNLIEKYYDIENFEEKYVPKKLNRNKHPRAKSGERIKQALEIIGVSSVEELNETHIPKIKDLRRGDFLQRGIQIPSNTMAGLKKRLIEKAKNRHKG
jgi:DNA-binding IscR family transcriptional regulator